MKKLLSSTLSPEQEYFNSDGSQGREEYSEDPKQLDRWFLPWHPETIRAKVDLLEAASR